jgi:hypothetical protein
MAHVRIALPAKTLLSKTLLAKTLLAKTLLLKIERPISAAA